MSLTEAVRTVLSKYATFSGRAARPEYWWWCLFVFLLSIATNIIDASIVEPAIGLPAFGAEAVQPLSAIVGLALLLPGLAVSVRRLHDLDRSGWWLLIVFIPIIGVLILLYWFVCRGTQGPNRFGAAP